VSREEVVTEAQEGKAWRRKGFKSVEEESLQVQDCGGGKASRLSRAPASLGQKQLLDSRRDASAEGRGRATRRRGGRDGWGDASNCNPGYYAGTLQTTLARNPPYCASITQPCAGRDTYRSIDKASYHVHAACGVSASSVVCCVSFPRGSLRGG